MTGACAVGVSAIFLICCQDQASLRRARARGKLVVGIFKPAMFVSVLLVVCAVVRLYLQPTWGYGEYYGYLTAAFAICGVALFAGVTIALTVTADAYEALVQTIGARATAKILEVHNMSYSEASGTRSARLVLRVEPADSEPFRAEAMTDVGVGDARLVFLVGAEVEVRYDPSNLRRAMLAPASYQVQGEPHRAEGDLPPEERLKLLENLRAKGLVTEEEYAEKRRQILGRL